jgi:hypothetical protein
MSAYSILHPNKSSTDLSMDGDFESKVDDAAFVRPRPGSSFARLAWVFHAVMVVSNLCLMAWTLSLPTARVAMKQTTLEGVGSESRKFEFHGIYLPDGSLNPHLSNNFTGPPRASLDAAWKELQRCTSPLDIWRLISAANKTLNRRQ